MDRFFKSLMSLSLILSFALLSDCGKRGQERKDKSGEVDQQNTSGAFMATRSCEEGGAAGNSTQYAMLSGDFENEEDLQAAAEAAEWMSLEEMEAYGDLFDLQEVSAPQDPNNYDFQMALLGSEFVVEEQQARLGDGGRAGGARPAQRPNRPVQQPNRPVQRPNRPVQQPNRPNNPNRPWEANRPNNPNRPGVGNPGRPNRPGVGNPGRPNRPGVGNPGRPNRPGYRPGRPSRPIYRPVPPRYRPGWRPYRPARRWVGRWAWRAPARRFYGYGTCGYRYIYRGGRCYVPVTVAQEYEWEHQWSYSAPSYVESANTTENCRFAFYY